MPSRSQPPDSMVANRDITWRGPTGTKRPLKTLGSLSQALGELALSTYSVEKLQNALAAFSCQAESPSPVQPMNRQRTNQKAHGGVQPEVACPPASEMQRSL